jgi:hypothetical protein
MKRVDIEELKAIVEKLEDSPLDEESRGKLQAAVDAYRHLAELVGEEGATVEGVRERFFERYRIVRTGEPPGREDTDSASDETLPGR